VKLSQRIAIFLFCCLVGSATHSIFAQTAAEGLGETAAAATEARVSTPTPTIARRCTVRTFAAHPLAGFTLHQSFDSSTSEFFVWSIRHDLAQNLNSLRSSAGQEAVLEDQLQVLAPTNKEVEKSSTFTQHQHF